MREERYSTLLPVEALKNREVQIIGVGAIGRQIAVQLASMGVGNLTIIDFDRVDENNLGTQGWFDTDVGFTKVDALERHLKSINPEITVTKICDRWKRSRDRAEIVFACVDSMSVRKMIFENFGGEIMIDGRMSAEAFRAFAITRDDTAARVYYGNTIFTDNRADQTPCTAKSTIYCSNIIAGVMVGLYTRFLRGMKPPKEVEMSVLGLGMDTIF